MYLIVMMIISCVLVIKKNAGAATKMDRVNIEYMMSGDKTVMGVTTENANSQSACSIVSRQ